MSPRIDQLALADFLERGDLDRHLRRTRLPLSQVIKALDCSNTTLDR
jgi:DNA-binding transcriptional MocR family regulator